MFKQSLIMALIEWNAVKYSVKINEFDAHHQKLIQLINQLHDGMLQAKGRQIIAPIIEELHRYTIYHFSAEEKMMQQYLYPDYTRHKKMHDSFVAQINDLKQKLAEGDYKVSVETYSFLKDWLVQHIMKSDQQYTTYFVSKGIVK